MSRRWPAWCLAAAATLAATGTGRAETFVLTTLEWCPYTCSALPGGGASTEVVRSALKAAGHDLEVEFLPWVRAVRAAGHAPRYGGYFPEYAGDVAGFTLSEVIGSGPLGVAEHKERPLAFHSVADLSAYRLGTVRGYLNTAELDAAIAAGRQPVEENVSDASNLLKLALRRIDGTVIDGRVMAYLLDHEPDLRPARPVLRFNPRLLENKTLHVAVAPSEAGRRLAAALKLGLGRIDANAVQSDYLHRIGIDLDGPAAALPVSPPRSKPPP